MAIELFNLPDMYTFNRDNKSTNATDFYFWGRNDGSQDLQALNPGMFYTSANITYYDNNIFSVKVPSMGLNPPTTVHVRHNTNTGTDVSLPGRFANGIQIALIGQSNVPEIGSITSITCSPPGMCRLYKRGDRYDPAGSTETVIDSPQNIPGIYGMMTQIYASRPDIPIMFLMMGFDGSTLDQWNGQNFDYTASNQFPYLQAHYDHYRSNTFKGPEIAVWLGGEAEMLHGVSKADVKTKLGTLHQNLLRLFRRTQSDFTLILTLPSSTVNQNSDYSSVTTAQITAVRDAITEYQVATPGVILGGDRDSVQLADHVHLARNSSGAQAHGMAIGTAIAGVL